MSTATTAPSVPIDDVRGTRGPLSGRLSRRLSVPGAAAVAVAVGVLAGYLGPALLHPNLVHDDAGQHLWWNQRAWGGDPTAYSEIARYFASSAAAPPAWRWLMAGFGATGNVQRAAEVANVAVVLVAAGLTYLLARRCGRPSGRRAAAWGGLAACATLVLSREFTANLYEVTLLQRGFAAPLTALALWALLARRLAWLGVAFVGTALVYPIMIAVLGLTAVAHELWRLWRDRRMPRGWAWAAAGGVAALVLILVVRDVPEAYGSMVTAAESRRMPVFGPQGRSSIWGLPFYDRVFTHSRMGLGLPPLHLGVGLATAAAAVVLAGGFRRVPALIWITIGCSLLLWAAAWATLFDLYLPNRHVRVTLPMAWILLVAVAAAGLARRARLRTRRRGWGGNAVRAGRVAVAVVVAAAAGTIAAPKAWRLLHRYEWQSRTQAYEYLRTLPPDAILAGHPEHVSLLTLWTGRPVLISRETTQAYYTGYYDSLVLPRLDAALGAYYAPDWATVDRLLHAEHGVRAFYYRPERLNDLPYEEPFRTIARRHLRRMGDGEPAMYRPPTDRVLFNAGDVFVIRVGPPGDDLPQGPVPADLRERLDALPPPPRYDPALHDGPSRTPPDKVFRR